MAAHQNLDPRILGFIVQRNCSGSAKTGGHGEGKRKNQHVTSPIVQGLMKSYAERSTTEKIRRTRVVCANRPRPLDSLICVDRWFRNMLKNFEI